MPRYSLWQYVLFVSFFPQLIAGPILRHGEIFHQYQDRGFAKFCSRNVVVGFGIFVLGLFKKTVVGDNLGRFADPLFSAADAGVALSLFEAWAAMLFFSFQIYFDFSGYSDMAVGLARMLNVQLPFNFNSPYRSRNIVEFWRRWHITLGAFLRDYLYVPLGGNKRGTLRLLTNLFTVMCLGGIWHGAGWTFLAWGAYHGVLLMAAHGFQIFRGSSKRDYFKLRAPAWLTDVVTVLSTFLFVSFGWIFFRSADLATAFSIVQGLVGQNGTMFDFSGQVIMFSDALFGKTVSPSDVQIFPNDVADFINDGIYWLLLSAVLTFGCPSMKSILESHGKSFGDVPIVGGAFSRLLISQKNQKLVAVSVVIVFVAALLFVDVENEFLYFQF